MAFRRQGREGKEVGKINSPVTKRFVGLGVACGKDVKGAGRSLIDTMLHEGGTGQDLRGGSCHNEETVWGEAMGVEC